MKRYNNNQLKVSHKNMLFIAYKFWNVIFNLYNLYFPLSPSFFSGAIVDLNIIRLYLLLQI